MSGMVCPSFVHEAGKRVDGWWRAQRLIGFTVGRTFALELRNCRVCESTLGKRCAKEAIAMEDEAPDGFWISAAGYARLAAELEADGHLSVADHYYARAQAAAVQRFEETCARGQLVGVDEVPEHLEPTEVLPDPMDAYWDRLDRDHARAERRAGR